MTSIIPEGTTVARSGRAELLQALNGTMNAPDHERCFEFFLALLTRWMKGSCLQDTLNKNAPDANDAAYSALATVANMIRTTAGTAPSLEQMMLFLADKNIFPPECKDIRASDNTVWIQMVFAMVSWLTLTYKTDHRSQLQEYLSVDQESRAVFQSPSQLSADIKMEPVDVMIHRFGEILPQKAVSRSLQPGQEIIKVSQLNASHLWKVKNIRVKWAMTIGTHLVLDKTSKTLCVFCLPSVLKLQSGNPDSPLTRILGGFHNDYTRPEDFSAEKLFDEIIKSYHVLFRDDPSARKFYRRQRKTIRAGLGVPSVDPCLDHECGYKQRHDPQQATSEILEIYRKSVFFPILSDRLTELQNFAAEEQTNKFWAPLRDKSDTKERSQFIVVVIFGVIALLLATLNTILAAFQTAYSIKSYTLSAKQQG